MQSSIPTTISRRSRANIAINLRLARQLAGWTQLELAARAGMDNRTLSRMERNESEPLFRVLAAVALVLKLDMNKLMDDPPEDWEEQCWEARQRYSKRRRREHLAASSRSVSS